jgi:hypothetical protein
MSEIPKNNNEILGYHPVTPSIKIISAGKIKDQIIQDRFELEADDKELEHITDVPVEVLFSHESRRYIPVKGRRIIHAGIEQGIIHLHDHW